VCYHPCILNNIKSLKSVVKKYTDSVKESYLCVVGAVIFAVWHLVFVYFAVGFAIGSIVFVVGSIGFG
jgi:hypothetical protein